MDKKRIYGTYEVDGAIFKEDFLCDYSNKDAFIVYTEILREFNEEEQRKYGDKIIDRKPIKAYWDIGKLITFCDFQKTNLVTKKDSKGYYDEYECRNCGRVKKMRTLDMSGLKDIICPINKK